MNDSAATTQRGLSEIAFEESRMVAALFVDPNGVYDLREVAA